MKLCVFGCGAIGSHLAARLAAARAADVAIVARGPHLDAIRRSGLALRTPAGETIARDLVVASRAEELPAQDLVIVTLKAHSLSAAAPGIARLIGPQGAALFILNGLPWWWRSGEPAAGPFDIVDPGGRIWAEVGPERALAGVVYTAGHELAAPGLAVGRSEPRWILGEPDGRSTPRLARAVELFGRAALTVEPCADIRREIWRKLAVNAAGGPLAALTRLDSGAIADDPDLAALKAGVMRDIVAVAGATGCRFAPDDLAALGAPSRDARGRRPSMLQDALAGRPLEVEAVLGAPQHLARRMGIATPTIDLLLPLLRGLGRAAGARAGASG